MDDGAVHRDDVAKLLRLLGVSPNEAWIAEIFPSVTRYSSLKLEDFHRFVAAYEEFQQQSHSELFAKFDKDGSGTIDTSELSALYRDCGLEPMPHILLEVLEEVDNSGDGTVDLDEFLFIMHTIKDREGFSRKEVNRLLGVRDRLRQDEWGRIPAEELEKVLLYLGHKVELAVWRNLLKEVDVDGIGWLDRNQYLLFLRKVREHELAIVKRRVEEGDTDGSGTIDTSELPPILEALDYWPDEDGVREALAKTGLEKEAKQGMDITMFWRFLEEFRQLEGLSHDDSVAIQETMREFGTPNDDGDLEISTGSVDMPLRWMGFQLNFDTQRLIIASVDIDGSGKLDTVEFRKLIRMCIERENKELEAAFANATSCGLLAKSQAVVTLAEAKALLMETLGPTDEQGTPTPLERGDLGDAGGVGVRGLLKASTRRRRGAIACARRCEGFLPLEILGLRERFHRLDADGSGDIARGEMIALLEELFPKMAHDPQSRYVLQACINEANTDNDDSLSFDEYLRLVRQSQEISRERRSAKEADIMEKVKFTPEEVHAFRALFLSGTLNGDQEMGWSEVRQLMNGLVPMGDRNVAILEEAYRMCAADPTGGIGSDDEVDFPEFLLLMRHLMDTNFGGIKELLGVSQSMFQSAQRGL